MNDLLAQVLDSHSNLSRWNELKGIRVKAVIGGGIWKFKGNPDIINSELIDVDCHRQWIRYTPFGSSDRRSVFEPERNAIETLDGRVLEERNHPREAFAGHVPNTPWDDLHVVYFSGYAMWGYLTAPFHFVMPGVETEEVEPWDEQGATWRRLQVRYPVSMAEHCPVQTFYFDDAGLMQRVDYSVDIMGAPPSAHYMSGHRKVGGIVFPTERKVYGQIQTARPFGSM